ncbi:MAG TPA: putative glycoside hydrolase [Puia sp.]|jgi:hypothetical protein
MMIRNCITLLAAWIALGFSPGRAFPPAGTFMPAGTFPPAGTFMPAIPPDGVPLAQIFDTKEMDSSEYGRYPNKVYFIWGAHAPGQPQGVTTSKYFPSMRNPDPKITIEWYKEHHPDWIMYQEDRKTPAYGYIYSYGGLVPLDISNPEVRDYYLDSFIVPAVREGYQMVAMDNVDLANWPKSAGHFSKGRWVQQYTGKKDDAAFHRSIIGWMQFLSERLHPMGVGVCANIKSTSAPPAVILEVMQHVDMWLDETGFTHKGNNVTDGAWESAFSLLQKIAPSKGYVSINQVNGPVATADPAQLEWVIGNFLLSRGPQSLLSVVGFEKKAIYHRFDHRPEMDLNIGTPVTAPQKDASGAWMRKYTGGLVLVNPSSTTTAKVLLPKGEWKTTDGHSSGREIVLPPASAAVLTAMDKGQCQAGRVTWAANYPMVFVGDWDMKPLFKRRVGGSPIWQEENYTKEHTEERVKKYKDMGATMLMMHFYKGFGLEAEKEEIADSKRLAQLCRKYGLKVGVYVGATLFYETFLAEKPEAKDWLVPDYMGKPVTYGSQTFRKLVYFQHPGYKEYIKRVLKIAIEDLKADVIHFDNSSVQAIPPVFYHPLAVQQFRDFLRNKYTPAQLEQRLGFSDVSYVEPPPYSGPAANIDDPLAQEWTDFRCQRLADYYTEMAQYIRQLNPNVAVECNPHGLAGRNTMWEQSVDFPRLIANTDFFFSEGEETGLSDGVLLSKIRTYKMARTLDSRVFVTTGHDRLKMAESMAYNRQGMGLINDNEEMDGTATKDWTNLPADEKAYIDFFHKHFDDYRGVKGLADVAVLHTYATMAVNSDRPYQSTALFEQTLLQHKIPFDILFDKQLTHLDRYKVLVLADQECLTENQLQLIRVFVAQGGSLVSTEQTSLFTEGHRRKPDFGLGDLFNVKAPEWKGRNAPEEMVKGPIRKNSFGKGRVVYIPEVRPAVAKPAAAPMAGKYLQLPLNDKELVDAIDWACGNDLLLQVNGPLTVTAGLWEKEDNSALVLHLVNFNYQRQTADSLSVDIRIPEGRRLQQVTVRTPDGRPDENLAFKVDGRHAAFAVPRLAVYDMIVLKLQ